MIQYMTIANQKVVMLANDNGRLLGLPPDERASLLAGEPVVGDVCLALDLPDDFGGIPDDQLEDILDEIDTRTRAIRSGRLTRPHPPKPREPDPNPDGFDSIDD